MIAIPAWVLPATTADPYAPILSQDEAIVDGQTLFCYDFGLSDTWDDEPGAVAAGSQYGNVLPGAKNGVVVGAGAVNDPGRMSLPNTTVYLQRGTVEADYDLDDLPDAAGVVLISWFRPQVAMSANRSLAGRAGQIAIGGGGGATTLGLILNGANVPGVSFGPMTIGTLYQIAASIEPNGDGSAKWRIFINGEQRAAGDTGFTGWAARLAGYPFGRPQSGYGGLAAYRYRDLLSRLDLIEGTDPAAIVAADYTAHYARIAGY